MQKEQQADDEDDVGEAAQQSKLKARRDDKLADK